jgi:hypothetical protein
MNSYTFRSRNNNRFITDRDQFYYKIHFLLTLVKNDNIMNFRVEKVDDTKILNYELRTIK